MAAACYLRSSERLFNWLVNHPRLGQSIRLYIKRKAVPLKVKLISLAIAWAVLGGTALFVVEGIYVRALPITLVVVKTIFMVRFKTLKAET